MKKILLLSIVAFLLICSCSENQKSTNQNTNPGGFKDPVVPSVGTGWPPQHIRSQFSYGNLEKPDGMEDIDYETMTAASSTSTTTYFEDNLSIYFVEATHYSRYVVENYLRTNEYVVSTRWPDNKYGWKVEQNILYWFSYRLVPLGHYHATRATGSRVKFGFPPASDLAIFCFEDMPSPSGINNMYYYLETNHDSRLFGRFTSDTSIPVNQIINFFYAKTGTGEYGVNDAWTYMIDGDTVYTYDLYREGDIVSLEFNKFVNIPTAEVNDVLLEEFSLDDWEFPSGLTSLNCLSNKVEERNMFAVYFTEATDEAIRCIKAYLETKGISCHTPHDTRSSGSYFGSSTDYSYYYKCSFTADNGGFIRFYRFKESKSVYHDIFEMLDRRKSILY